MGSILDGLNPVNKIGTAPTNANSTLNTISTQGFKLNSGNLLSNITNPKQWTPPEGFKFSNIVPKEENLTQANGAPVRTLAEASGYEVHTLEGKSAWVPNGSSYNDIAKLLGAPSNQEVLGAVVDGVLNTIDYVALRGAGKFVVAGRVIATAGQAKRASLVIRGAGSAFNYHYGQGYDLPSSLLMALGTQANFANLKNFADLRVVKNSKLLSAAANTSKDYYKFLHHSEFFPDNFLGKQRTIFGGANPFSGDNLLKKNVKGANWNAYGIQAGFLPFNPGLYILNKTWFTPTAIAKGKVGVSQAEYESKKEAQHDQEEIILAGLEQLETQNSTAGNFGSVENIYETKFLQVLAKAENQQKASDLGGASKRFSDKSADIQKEGLNLIGQNYAYQRAFATFAYEQIDEFQSYKAEQNDYQNTLFKTGNYLLASKELPKTVAINLGLSTANVALGLGRFIVNANEVVSQVPRTLAQWGVIQAQVQLENLKEGLENLSNWWNNEPDKVERVTTPANSIKETKSKSPKASITNTMINMPTVLPPTKMVDNVRVAGPVSNNPAILDRYKTPEQIAIRESSIFIKNIKDEQQKKLDKIVEDHEIHWYTWSKPKWTPAELKEQQRLTVEIAKLSQLLKGVADAVKSGRLKYDPFTRKVSKLW